MCFLLITGSRGTTWGLNTDARWRERAVEHRHFQHRTQSNQRLRKETKELGKIEILRGQLKKEVGLGVLCGGSSSLGSPIYTLPGADQGLAPPEIHCPSQGQGARDFLGAGFLLARGHQAGEV